MMHVLMASPCRVMVLYCFLLLNLLITHSYGDTCHQALIDGASLTASSEISKDRSAKHAILYGAGSWSAGQSDFGQYLIIDLGSKKNITSIGIQGKPYSSEFVQEFRLDYGNDGQDFASYRDRNGNIKLFEGNRDGDHVMVNTFEPAIIGQFLRINPTRWRDRISMRVQVYGCDYTADSMHLSGDSYVRINLRKKPIASYEDLIRFRFRTNDANGHILLSKGTQRDFLSLRLEANKLVFALDLGGGGDMSQVTAGSLLDDNLWHDVLITRNQRDVVLTVDRVMVKHHIKGDFVRLDLNHEMFIGGIPVALQTTSTVNSNFSGCLENLMFNHTNLIQELKTDEKQWLYQRVGEILFSCRFEEIIPVTFVTDASHIRVDGFYNPFMNCSFDFRTFNEDGLMMFNKFSSTDGFLKVYLDKGKLMVQVKGTATPIVMLDPFPDRKLNDGLWHPTRIVLKTDLIIIELDGKPSYTVRKFEMITGQTYLIGGGLLGSFGFIGCIRNLYVEGRNIHVKSLAAERIVRVRPSDILFDSCHMRDRCHPNPCEHQAVCRQTNHEFTCDCSNTGYHGSVCHTSKHPLSCEANKIDQFPRTKKADIQIDVDGSGPLDPFSVTCLYLSEDRTQTILHHSSEGSTMVRGFQDPGSYVRDIRYDADFDQIGLFVNRSYTCKQTLRYECLNARLFNSPYSSPSGLTLSSSDFKPFSWWVSRNNQQMDYWGGSLPGTRRCACGLYGSCKDSRKWCNCDSGVITGEVFVDEGDLVEKDFLPVRQLRFGDTGTFVSNNKWGKFTLGPLVCEGDSMFDRSVTLRYEDATVDLPTFDMGYSADVYLQFKTTADSGVLLHSKGPEDFVKLTLTTGKSMQFSFSSGSGPKTVTIDSSYRLNDNAWHSVLIERNQKEARLIIDGKVSSEVRNGPTGTIRPLHLTSLLVIGATVEYREGYVGCIRSLLLNGNFVDLHSITMTRPLYGVSTGCQGKCESSPCLNNGTCIDRYSSYACDCQWTAFKGPICADEIGVNLRSDTYIRYDFETTISTLEENIRVGFTTTEHRGLILGVSSYTGEYLSLVMSTSGHLRLVFDFGFERQEIIIRSENFALGQHHDIRIVRSDKGSKITIYVDNNEPIIHTFTIRQKADAQFNALKSIFIGRNNTMDTGEGFAGCISRISFDDHFPLRRLFQENRRSNIHAFPSDDSVREDTCGIESVSHPPEPIDSRPPPSFLPEGGGSGSLTPSLSSILISVTVLLLIFALIGLFLFGKLFLLQQKGDYVTHEEVGARDADDPDTAVLKSKTGPDVTKKKEYFI